MATLLDRRDDAAEFRVPPREEPLPIPPAPPDPTYASRRRLLKWLIRLGYGAFALAFAVPALALRALSTPRSAVAKGDKLVLAAPTDSGDKGQPLKAAALPVGSGVQVFPQNKTDNQSNLIEVVRIKAGQGADGLVAYSAICTHLGCAVYAKLNQAGQIACPCHGSRFDPANGAKVVGGPAPRPLPSLPVAVDAEGVVVVNGGFSGPIGPQ